MAAAGELPSPQPQGTSRRLLQSPLGPVASASALHLGSNNDELERARARAAARAASVRRKSLSLNPTFNACSEADAGGEGDLLDHDQIMDLFQNCIKLAAENKINQKNTWELGLIDHISEIIRANYEEDNETNFQKASCTLEAGVKIYSLRVDSVHSEAYKVLGGINRAGHEGEHEKSGEIEHVHAAQEVTSKREIDRKLSPTSTLESSFEALNLKKFDAAFTVDPLYHQTSAQFDEGGAKGLLLYNLGVYGGCRVLFDSYETPDKFLGPDAQDDRSELIDLSSLREEIDLMIKKIPQCKDITPTLGDIIAQFDEENHRPSVVNFAYQIPAMEDDMPGINENEQYGPSCDDNEPYANADPDCGPWDFDNCDDQESYAGQSSFVNQNHIADETSAGNSVDSPYIDEKIGKIADFLSLSLGFSSNTNSWAGPDHWKFRKAKDLTDPIASSEESELVNKKTKSKKVVPDVEFGKELQNEMPNIFTPPKNPKSLLMPSNKAPCKNKLPEDCRYKADNLVRLFLLPDVMYLGRRGRRKPDDNIDVGPSSSWDDECSYNDNFNDGNGCDDTEDLGSLIRQPRQVNKIEIQYDKVAKQVDVHALKELLWNHIQETATAVVEEVVSVPLTRVLHHFPYESGAASSNQISPHLFFICLLHLANEHSLVLRDSSTLDEIEIHIPSLPAK